MTARLVGVGTYKHIAANATTLVKTGAGILKKIVIGTGAAGATTIYDAITAAAGSEIGAIAASATGTYQYDLQFKTGLTVVTEADNDVTVVYE
jgi:ABC-type uncharacterized transport system ATPase subunit